MEPKGNEELFQHQLFDGSHVGQTNSAHAILKATQQTLANSTRMFEKKDLDNLQAIIDQ